MTWLARLAIGLWLTLFNLSAHSHTQSVSYSVWHLDEQVISVHFRISQLELNRLGLHPGQPDYPQQIAELANQWLLVQGDCTAAPSNLPRLQDGQVVLSRSWQCKANAHAGDAEDAQQSRPLTLGLQGIFERINYHSNLAAIYLPEGRQTQTTFNAQQQSWTYTKGESASGFGPLFAFGLTHILTGWDHLLFLLVLLLSVRRVPNLLAMVTGFTIGHSLTLALQVLGIVTPPAVAVEWVIALSILLVAMQNTWASQQRQSFWPYWLCLAAVLLGWMGGAVTAGLAIGLGLFILCQLRWQQTHADPIGMTWLVTLAFGLFHGFGFAGLLGQLHLPAQSLAGSLLAFNLGVEAGQLIMIAAALPLLVLLRKLTNSADAALNATAAGAATFWLITRTF